MTRNLFLTAIAVISLSLLAPTPAPAVTVTSGSRAAAKVPTAKQWRKDVRQAMADSGKYPPRPA